MTQDAPPVPSSRPRVLVVDDEALVAMLLEDMLADLGCEVVATVGRVDQALQLVSAGSTAFDVAVLDVNVAGESVQPVAEAVAALGKSIIFATGYGESGVPQGFKDRPILQKPFGFNDVAARLAEARGD